MKIAQMPEDEKPRERMMRQGASALTNAELLAVLLRTGTVGLSAIEMARKILESAGGKLITLGRISAEGLRQIPGIGPTKALQLLAVFELSKRMAMESISGKNRTIATPEDAFTNLHPLYCNDISEECWCLFLKGNRQVIGNMQVSKGGDSMTTISSKAIIRRALELGARGVIISHNHPSGDVTPSTADISATENLQKAMETFDLTLMDHIIISGGHFYSFVNNGEFVISGKKCNKM